MPQRKQFYAIAKSRLTPPGIFAPWELAQPLVTQCGYVDFKGFRSQAEAERFLLSRDCTNYTINIQDPGMDQAPLRGDRLYAVSAGYETGVFREYSGGAEPEVRGFSGACHKSYRSLEECEKAILAHKKGQQMRKAGETAHEEIMSLMSIECCFKNMQGIFRNRGADGRKWIDLKPTIKKHLETL